MFDDLKLNSIFQLASHLTLLLRHPLVAMTLFILSSVLMIFRLSALEQKGIEGTILGTLVMPYCSGISNLIFAFVLGRKGGDGSLVLENCLINNVTNLTLLIGLPAMIWGITLRPPPKKAKAKADIFYIKYLSLILTLIALFFFTGILWALARDGVLDFGDGIVLVGVFLFWQIFHVFDVLKQRGPQSGSLIRQMGLDLFIIASCAYGVFVSIDHLVAYIATQKNGLISFANIGWLSGFLMVLPNGLLAIYYAKIGRSDIVYASQIGDGHVCIPMCIGIFALFTNVMMPSYFQLGMWMILCAAIIHFFWITLFRRMPKWMGILFTGAYFIFLYKGLIKV